MYPSARTMKPEPSLWIGWFERGPRRGALSSWGPWKKRSSSEELSLASFFFVTSMMTTQGATISKTFVNALLSWWTTSLPASATAGGTVEVGPVSGWARGGAASRVEVAKARARMQGTLRMVRDWTGSLRRLFNWR